MSQISSNDKKSHSVPGTYRVICYLLNKIVSPFHKYDILLVYYIHNVKMRLEYITYTILLVSCVSYNMETYNSWVK